MQGCCCTHSHHHGMAGQGAPMPDMKAQVEKMRATLEQMKANLAKIKDPALKQQAQLDVDLWEAMVEHAEGMVKMMSEGPDKPSGDRRGRMDCCGGIHKRDGCCAGMKQTDGGKCMHGDTTAKVVPAD
jgi:hypothetical protein